MAAHRVSRLNEQLRRELTDILRLHVRDPRVGMVTVTDVRVTSDLDSARVFIQTAGDVDERAATLQGLRAAAAFIRGELGRRLTIRHIPELRFEIDETLQHARRIEELLAQVRPAEPEPELEPEEPEELEEPEDEGDEDDAVTPDHADDAGNDKSR